MSETLPPRGLQHVRLPCPSLPPRVCSGSCPLSWWCHSAISSSVAYFSACFQSFPTSFPVSWLFASGCQIFGASASVFPMNIQGWFPLGFTGLISLLSKRPSRVFSNTTVQKHQFFGSQAFFMLQLWHPYMTTWKTIALTMVWRIFVGKEVSVLYNMLSRFVVAFLPRSKHVLISWLQSPPTDFGENKVCHCSHFSPSICLEVMGPDAMILVFWMLRF